jgi:hypothetical protein
MEWSRREIALVVLAIGILMICASVWLDRRRKHQLMPSLIAPMPLKILGGAIAFISLAVAILPN